MTSTRISRINIDLEQWSGFFDELGSESERGAAILASVWIEYLLERKLRAHFTKGNSETRRKLFDLNGPFSAFSSKILVAHSLDWIDSSTCDDINLIRKIRNKFAHEAHGIDLDCPEIRELVGRLKIPGRKFHDWSEFRAAATKDGKGVILYTGDRPDEAGDALSTQRFRYLKSVSLLVAEVAASLGVVIRINESTNETDTA